MFRGRKILILSLYGDTFSEKLLVKLQAAIRFYQAVAMFLRFPLLLSNNSNAMSLFNALKKKPDYFFLPVSVWLHYIKAEISFRVVTIQSGEDIRSLLYCPLGITLDPGHFVPFAEK